MLATAVEALPQKEDNWGVAAAASIARNALVGDLVSGHWAVQDRTSEAQAAPIGYNGSALHGFEPTVISAPEPPQSEDGESVDGVLYDTLHVLLRRAISRPRSAEHKHENM